MAKINFKIIGDVTILFHFRNCRSITRSVMSLRVKTLYLKIKNLLNNHSSTI